MKVILRVYKIGTPQALELLNKLLKKNFKGIWHTSIEVYGKEIFYNDTIIRTIPDTTIHKLPHVTHDMGSTEISEEEFELFLNNLEEKFGNNKYHLLENNCNHFTNFCTEFLVNKQIPDYITEVHEFVLENEVVANMAKMFFVNRM